MENIHDSYKNTREALLACSDYALSEILTQMQ